MHNFLAIPKLETSRLVLRAHRIEDFEPCAKIWADPKVTLYIGGVPFPPSQTWRRLLGYVGHWQLMGYGYWAIEEKVSGEFIGEMGFADFKRDLVPSISERPELGWVLASAKHGKGLATEALRVIVDWGDKNLGAAQTVCLIDPQNLASLQVAKKLGFQKQLTVTYANQPTELFARIRKELKS